MEHAAGAIGALGFWVFLAVTVVAGIWYDVRRREAEHETLRRLIESGQTVDQMMMHKLLGSRERPDRGLRTGGLIISFLALGLVLLGWFVSRVHAPALMPMLGTAALMACIGAGLLVAAKVAERGYREDSAEALNQTRDP